MKTKLLDDFKKFEKEGKTIEFWEAVGFIMKKDDKQKSSLLAKEYDRLSRYLLACDNHMSTTEMAAFAAVRRIVLHGGPNEDYSPMRLCDTIESEFKKAASDYSSIPYGEREIDYEVELTALIAEKFYNETKDL